jgi:hypothetical protein
VQAYIVSGKNLEYGLRKQGLLRFVRELDGNDEEQYDHYLTDASMYARGRIRCGGTALMWLLAGNFGFILTTCNDLFVAFERFIS